MSRTRGLRCSPILLLAVAGCQSLSVPGRPIQPDRLTPPSLPEWIREPPLQPNLTRQLPQILLGSPAKGTPPLSASTPASPPTTP